MKISGDQGITLTVDGLNWVQMKWEDVKLLYNPGDRKFESVGEKMLEWEPCPSRGWAPRPPVEQPRRTGKKCCCSQKSWRGVNMLQFCSVSNSPLTDNTFRNHFEPFQIKWEVYFSKELCPLVFIVLNMFLHASAYEYVTQASICFQITNNNNFKTSNYFNTDN